MTTVTNDNGVISSLADLKAVFAEYCDGPRGEFVNLDGELQTVESVPVVRAAKLAVLPNAANNFFVLNKYQIEFQLGSWVDPNQAGILEELLGLELSGPDDVVFTTIGEKSYSAKRNLHNRPPKKSRSVPITKEGTYSNMMRRMLWASLRTDCFTWDWRGQIVSARNRLEAMLVARNAGVTLPWIYCVFGAAPQFSDYCDKAAPRSKKDDNYASGELFTREVVSLIQLHETGIVTPISSWEKEKENLVKLRIKVCSDLENRMSGKDIGSTGGKQDSETEQEIADRCGTIVIQQFERTVTDPVTGRETVDSVVPEQECNALDYLCVRVHESSKSQSGKQDMPWSKLFAPSVVVSTLVLASNSESYLNSLIDVARHTDETIEEFNDRIQEEQLRLLSPDSELRIDWELVDRVLTMLKTSMPSAGPLGDIFKSLETSVLKHKADTESTKILYKPVSIASMSACVQLVKNIVADDLTSSIFTTYSKIKGTKNYSPAYRCFGGRDIGYQAKESKSKKSAE